MSQQNNAFDPNCIATITNTNITLKEKNSKVNFYNPKRKRVTKVWVDNCQIQQGKRCDYLLLSEKEYFVELKGNKVKEGIEQIERSIPLLSQNPQKEAKKCFVISQKVPKASTRLQNKKTPFKKNFNADLFVKNKSHEEEIK